MDSKLPRIEPGDELLASHITAPNDLLNSLNINVGQGSGLGKSEGPNGTTLWAILPTEYWAKITGGGGGTGGSSGPYSWIEQIPKNDNDWDDGFNQGTTDADGYPA
jgi:hypothetical protein